MFSCILLTEQSLRAGFPQWRLDGVSLVSRTAEGDRQKRRTKGRRTLIPLRDINPTERFAIITFCLIALNIAVFVFELAIGDKAGNLFVESFALVPERLFSPHHPAGNALPAW